MLRGGMLMRFSKTLRLQNRERTSLLLSQEGLSPPFGLPVYSSRQPIRPDARQGVWPRLGTGMRKIVREKLQSWRVMGVSFADVAWLGLTRGY